MRRSLWSHRFLILLLAVSPVVVSSGCSCSNPVDRRAKYPRKYVREEDPPPKPAQPVQPGATGTPGEAAVVQGQPGAVQAQPATAPPGTGATPAPAGAKPAKPQELPAGGANSIVIAPIDPNATSDVTARRGYTIERMKKIGLAIGDYVREKGQYPAPAIYNRDKYPLLSWRVSLLPYLGHAELHQKFHLNEPWNSEHNKKLLAEIPPVFQSPERSDEKTNYLLVTGPLTMFSGQEGPKPADVADGLANTAMLVEVDDAKAIVWTQPNDHVYNAEQDPRLGLNALRDDGFFVVWANASIGRMSPDAYEHYVRAMFTRSGRESFHSASVSLPAAAHVDPEYAGRVKTPPPTRPVATLEPTTPPVGTGVTTPVTPGGVVRTPVTPVSEKGVKLPEPSEEEQKKSQALFREIFRADFENAKKPEQKYELAKRLGEHVKKVKDDPAGRYVLLKYAGNVAADVGDVTTAMSYAEQLGNSFDVDAHEIKAEIFLRAADQPPRTKADNDKLILMSEELLTQSLFNDNYVQANKIVTAGLAAARRGKEKIKIDDLAARKREVELARLSYSKVEKVVDTLQDDPDDPDSNLTVGKYMCFIKHNWERGLPMLAVGSDDGLKRLAREELKQPLDAEEQTLLADQWWELADREKERDSATRKEMQLRAVYWYLAATNRLPAGLLQVKAEVRIKEAEKLHGKEAVAAQKGRT